MCSSVIRTQVPGPCLPWSEASVKRRPTECQIPDSKDVGLAGEGSHAQTRARTKTPTRTPVSVSVLSAAATAPASAPAFALLSKVASTLLHRWVQLGDPLSVTVVCLRQGSLFGVDR